MALEATIGLRITPMVQHLTDTALGLLTQARDLIGNLHQSSTCGRTQEFKVYTQTPYKLQAMSLIAKSVLESTLKEASYFFTLSAPKWRPDLVQASSQALVFMSGTGFEQMIEFYQLAYDADSIRTEFYAKFHVKESNDPRGNHLPSQG